MQLNSCYILQHRAVPVKRAKNAFKNKTWAKSGAKSNCLTLSPVFQHPSMLLSKFGIQKKTLLFLNKNLQAYLQRYLRKEKPRKNHWSLSNLIRDLKRKRSTFLKDFEGIASCLACNKLRMISQPKQQQEQQQHFQTHMLQTSSKDSRQQQDQGHAQELRS